MLTPAGTIGRAQYIRLGVILMTLKYGVDTLLVYLWHGALWTPIDYVLSLASLSGTKAASFPPALSLAILLWTLPFIWVGVMLSVRRARDAGVPIWLVVLFFLPVANYVLMAALAAWPSAAGAPVEPGDAAGDPERRLRVTGLVAGVAVGLAAGVVLLLVGTMGLKTYGLAVFIADPFVVGFLAAYVYRRIVPGSASAMPVVLWTMGVLFVAVLLFAIEGLVCVLMAVPLVAPMLILGGLIGHFLAGTDARRKATIGAILSAAASGQAVDAAVRTAETREVFTAIEIAAPPERVWRNVVSFSDIQAPPAWYFRTGLSYPLRARIEGRGVGAVRYCEFTTGAFREPITAWEEPSRLAFDVVDQPAPLREWSPYRNVYAPHLKGFFRTTRGEFRLVPLPGGRTRLEGRTWYSLRMQPQGYWTTIADAILHRIHTRVLDHIRTASESGA